jgi:hypothetical protein
MRPGPRRASVARGSPGVQRGYLGGFRGYAVGLACARSRAGMRPTERRRAAGPAACGTKECQSIDLLSEWSFAGFGRPDPGMCRRAACEVPLVAGQDRVWSDPGNGWSDPTKIERAARGSGKPKSNQNNGLSFHGAPGMRRA